MLPSLELMSSISKSPLNPYVSAIFVKTGMLTSIGRYAVDSDPDSIVKD
jgi:hypothetical protein